MKNKQKTGKNDDCKNAFISKSTHFGYRIWTSKFVREIRGFFKGLEEANRDKATDQIEYEVKEMEHMFTLMIFGDAVGLPSPPISVTIELLPLMTDDFERMILRATQTGNGLSEIASIIGEP